MKNRIETDRNGNAEREKWVNIPSIRMRRNTVLFTKRTILGWRSFFHILYHRHNFYDV